MAQSATERLRFAVPTPLPLEVSFDGGRLTSDGGLAWLGEADTVLDLCATLSDGDTNQLITAVLRPGNVHGSHGVLAILRRLVERLRTQWPQVRIELRADSGFAVPALYEWCEQEVVPARCSGPKGGVGIRLRLVRQIWAANAVGG